jgi:hypothetical protein
MGRRFMAKSNQFSGLNVVSSLSAFEKLCPVNEYRILSSGEYPADLPTNVSQKFNQAVMVASGSSSSVVYMINGIRVDKDDLDEEPMIVAFDRDTGKGFGGIIHHGNWDGRTMPMPEEMRVHVSSSGIQSYFPLDHIPPSRSGSLSELMRSSQSAAFWS